MTAALRKAWCMSVLCGLYIVVSIAGLGQEYGVYMKCLGKLHE
jgi:hypothetical protein